MTDHALPEADRAAAVLPAVLAARPQAAGPVGGSYQISDAMAVTCIDVPAREWLVVMAAAKDAGGRLDWLGAVDLTAAPGAEDRAADDIDTEVVAGIRDGAAQVLIRTQVNSALGLASVIEIFPGARWHEREAAEMLGLRFIGGDSRPFLLAHPAAAGSHAQPPPLRRAFPLAARLARPWPGAAGARRRSRIPGNNPTWSESTR